MVVRKIVTKVSEENNEMDKNNGVKLRTGIYYMAFGGWLTAILIFSLAGFGMLAIFIAFTWGGFIALSGFIKIIQVLNEEPKFKDIVCMTFGSFTTIALVVLVISVLAADPKEPRVWILYVPLLSWVPFIALSGLIRIIKVFIKGRKYSSTD